MFQTVFGRAHNQPLLGGDAKAQFLGCLHVLDVFILDIGVILKIEAVGIHGRLAGGFGLGHAVGQHRIAHQADIRLATGFFRSGPIAAGIVLNDPETLHRVGDPAIRQPPCSAQPDRRPGRHPDRRTGRLTRAGCNQGVLIVKMLALKREALARPAFADNINGFFGPGGPLGNRNLERVEIVLLIPHAETQNETPLGRLVNHGAVFRHMDGMVERHQQHTRADLYAFGLHPDQTGQQQGVGQIAVFLLVVLGQKAAVPAAGLRGLGLGNHFINHPAHIRAGRGVLGTGKITNWQHTHSPFRSRGCLEKQKLPRLSIAGARSRKIENSLR